MSHAVTWFAAALSFLEWEDWIVSIAFEESKGQIDIM